MNNITYFKYQVIPLPLSKDIQEELVRKLVIGDPTARNELIIHNLRFVIYEVQYKFSNVLLEKEDLVSVGLYGLIKGIDTFDASRGAKFSTYITHCIDNEILMFIRKQKNYLKYTIDNVDVLMLPDSNTNIDLEYEEKEEKELLNDLLEHLDKIDKQVVKMYFGFFNERCYTQAEIAEKLNISQSYVSRIIAKDLNIIKFLLNNNISSYKNSSKIKTKYSSQCY